MTGRELTEAEANRAQKRARIFVGQLSKLDSFRAAWSITFDWQVMLTIALPSMTFARGTAPEPLLRDGMLDAFAAEAWRQGLSTARMFLMDSIAGRSTLAKREQMSVPDYLEAAGAACHVLAGVERLRATHVPTEEAIVRVSGVVSDVRALIASRHLSTAVGSGESERRGVRAHGLNEADRWIAGVIRGACPADRAWAWLVSAAWVPASVGDK